MAAQTSRYEDLNRFYGTVASITDLVTRELRDAGSISDLLQVVKENPNFAKALNLENARAASLVVKANRAIREGPHRRSDVPEPTRSWREENGVIYFSVISDGTTGEAWIERLESKGFRVGDYAKQLLHSKDFKPTSGVTTEIAVLKGMLFADDDRITKKIRVEAGHRKLTTPNAEVACLIREMFTDKEIEAMGLWGIVAMHEPIEDSVGAPNLLGAYRGGDGRWLDAYGDRPGGGWDRDCGFAFAVSQVSSQS